jgi:hypothetical protein
VVTLVVVRDPFHVVVPLVRMLPNDAGVMPDPHDAGWRSVRGPGDGLGRRGGQASGGEKTDERPDQQIAKRPVHWPSP